uniref:A-kinase anchor protein 1, mitochondrial n=1 Tax=Petromyzon marinus TaxID=7757 RepID=A0AAJ7TSP9_PETMA|nr:A-kinase anchor protein 1, mitochondrial [Petromyzon marinus]
MLWRALHRYYPYALPGVAAVAAWAWYSWRRKAACKATSTGNSTKRTQSCDGVAAPADSSRVCANPDDELNVCAAPDVDPLGPREYPATYPPGSAGCLSAEACVGPSVGDADGVLSAKFGAVLPDKRDGLTCGAGETTASPGETAEVPVAARAATDLSAGACESLSERETPVERPEDKSCDALPSSDAHDTPSSLAASSNRNLLAEPLAAPHSTSERETFATADTSDISSAADSISPLSAGASTDRSIMDIGDALGLVNNSGALLSNERKDLSSSDLRNGPDAVGSVPKAVAVVNQSPAKLDSPVAVETIASLTPLHARGSSASPEAGDASTSTNASGGKRDVIADARRTSEPARAHGSRRVGAADSTVAANAGRPSAVATICSRDVPSSIVKAPRATLVSRDVGESAPTLERSELRCQNGKECEAKAAAADGAASTNGSRASAGKMVRERNVSDGVLLDESVGGGAALRKAGRAATGGCDDGKAPKGEALERGESCEVGEEGRANDCGERYDPEGSDKVDPLCLKMEMGGKISRENYLGGSGKDDKNDDRFIQEAEPLDLKDTHAVRCSPLETASRSNDSQPTPGTNSVAVAGGVKCDLEIPGSFERKAKIPALCREEPESSPPDKTTRAEEARHNGGDAADCKAPEERFASGFVEKLIRDARVSFANVLLEGSDESENRPVLSSRLSAEAAPFMPTSAEATVAEAVPRGGVESPPAHAASEGRRARGREPAAGASPSDAKGKGDKKTAEAESLVKSNLSAEAAPFTPTPVENLPAGKRSVGEETSEGEATSENALYVGDLWKNLNFGVNMKELENSPNEGKSGSKFFPLSCPEGKWLMKDRTAEKSPKRKAVKVAVEFLDKNSAGGGRVPAALPVDVCTRGDPKEAAVDAEENMTNGLSTGSENSESTVMLDDSYGEAVSDGNCPCVTGSGDDGEMVIWEFHVSKILVGRLIGKQGKFINYLKEGSGAKIYIIQLAFTSDFQVVHIEGTDKQVDAALKLIRKKFKNLNMKNIAAPVLPPIGHVVVPVAPVPIPQGISVDVTVPWFDAYGNLFLQQYTHPTFHALDSLDQALNACYSQPNLPTPPPLSVNSVCAALLESHWYRAQIVEYYPESNEVEVKCLDYGGYYKILDSDLRQLRTDFLTLPFQASLVFFANIAPPPDHTCYSEEALLAVNKLTLGAHLIAEVTQFDTVSQMPFVNLWLIKDGRSQMINKMLVDAGHARWLS